MNFQFIRPPHPIKLSIEKICTCTGGDGMGWSKKHGQFPGLRLFCYYCFYPKKHQPHYVGSQFISWGGGGLFPPQHIFYGSHYWFCPLLMQWFLNKSMSCLKRWTHHCVRSQDTPPLLSSHTPHCQVTTPHPLRKRQEEKKTRREKDKKRKK